MQRYGGVSRYFYELVSRLAQMDEAAISLFLGFYVNEYGIERLEGLKSVRGLRRPDVRLSPAVFARLSEGWLAVASRMARPDILHQTYYAPRDMAPRGCMRVVTVYDMIHELHPLSERQKEWMVARKRPTIERSEGIIAISHHTKLDLMRLYDVPEARIRVIHLANSLTQVPAERSLCDRPYLLFVGTRDGYKNFGLLAAAYAHDPALRRDFDLVCFGGGAFSTKEHAHLDSLGLAGRVHHFAGPDETLATLYQHAAVFVYPSKYEGFGLPPLEAMHYGCPVIVSRTSSIPEVVGEAGLYFDPQSEESLTHALNRLVSDSALRADLVAGGHLQTARFSWDRCAKETLGYYRSVLASS